MLAGQTKFYCKDKNYAELKNTLIQIRVHPKLSHVCGMLLRNCRWVSHPSGVTHPATIWDAPFKYFYAGIAPSKIYA
jgi:hypothetical protein